MLGSLAIIQSLQGNSLSSNVCFSDCHWGGGAAVTLSAGAEEAAGLQRAGVQAWE